MIDIEPLQRIAQLLEQHLRLLAEPFRGADWYVFRLTANSTESRRVLQANPHRVKYRITNLSASNLVVLAPHPLTGTTAGELKGAPVVAAAGYIPLRDEWPFCYQGEIWGITDAGSAALLIEEWTTPPDRP